MGRIVSLTHCLLGNFFAFLSLADFLPNLTFSKNSFRNTIRVSNSFDQDQAGRFVWPDLCPNCFHKFSADNTRRTCHRLVAKLFILTYSRL